MNTSYAQPHRSPATVSRDIAEVRNTLMFAPKHNIAQINANIATLTAKATVDPTKYRGDLRMSLDNLEVAQRDVAAKHALSQRLEQLEAELVEAERLDMVDKREEAARQMAAAMNEFSVHARQAGLAYRKMAILARRQGTTQSLPRFHSSTLVPMSWQGIASDILMQNPDGLPSLNPEREAA